MADSKQNTTTAPKTETVDSKKIKVLYQYLGGQWYAFAEDESEVYFGKVPVQSSASDKSPQNSPKKMGFKKTSKGK